MGTWRPGGRSSQQAVGRVERVESAAGDFGGRAHGGGVHAHLGEFAGRRNHREIDRRRLALAASGAAIQA